MRKLTVILVFISFACFGQNTSFHTLNEGLTIGNYYFLFGDNVKLRVQPNANSEVLKLLKIGTKVKILEESGQKKEYNGVDSPYYQVQYNDEVGYIHGGLISIEKKIFGGNSYYFNFGKNDEKQILNIRLVNEDFTFIEKEIEIFTNTFEIDIFGNRGIESVDNIVLINCLAEACGVYGGGTYLFLEDDRLKRAMSITEISEAGFYWISEELVFPNDTNGVKGKIILKKEIGKNVDEETNWVEVTKISRELEWKNGRIHPNPDIESTDFKD